MNKLTLLPAVILLALASQGCSRAEASYLEVQDPKEVCMSNNYDMEAVQTPVTLDGKTYFVCCQGCKDTLTNFPKERIATDPVSGAKIDKSQAVIGRKPNGAILYFENVENLKKWRPEEKTEKPEKEAK